MSREIKFRAWLPNIKKMTYEHTLEELSKGRLWNMDGETNCSIVWLQYTGLNDKNGKEIYEGDIVKHESFSHVVYGIIVFGKIEVYYTTAGGHQGFYINWQNDGENRWGYWWRQDIYNWVNEVEVIGNIYENPELLEASNEM